ncbi:hypothetical protein [Lachnoclostridium phytofermentans]|uniref:hypothetical protein n=1 Tax=Lachnoclostridium phytofermentans TaxID=66219 RepID=UPI0002FC6C6A|nr:hypothetical protein [Lachnoclostridium phytofermentans]
MESSKNSKATPTKRTASNSSNNVGFTRTNAKQVYKSKSMRDDYYDDDDKEEIDEVYDSEDYY